MKPDSTKTVVFGFICLCVSLLCVMAGVFGAMSESLSVFFGGVSFMIGFFSVLSADFDD